jgi:regulatory protein
LACKVEHQSPPRSKPKTDLTPRGRALRLLARREHTRRELERKLAAHIPNRDELQALLDDLTARGWLSDARAAEHLVRAQRARFGAARIRLTLIARGVSNELIRSALADLQSTEVDAARSVWARKFHAAPLTIAERARQVRFLQSRGFNLDVAMRVVRGKTADDGE